MKVAKRAIRWCYAIAAIAIGLLLFPGPYKVEIYFDIVNGRSRRVEKTMGLKKSIEHWDQGFHDFVSTYKANEAPKWVLESESRSNILGQLTMHNLHSEYVRGYGRAFIGGPEHGDIPFATIRKVQTLARRGDTQALFNLLHRIAEEGRGKKTVDNTTGIFEM